MKKPKLLYFDEEDILHLVISEEQEANSIRGKPQHHGGTQQEWIITRLYSREGSLESAYLV